MPSDDLNQRLNDIDAAILWLIRLAKAPNERERVLQNLEEIEERLSERQGWLEDR